VSKNTIIEINGKRYDANTGQPLDAVVAAPSAVHHQPTARVQTKKSSRRAAKHVVRHEPTPSHTLMRQAVKKPHSSLKRQVKAQGSTDQLAKRHLAAVQLNHSVNQVDERRLRRSAQVAKSQLISHFSALQPAAPGNRYEPAAPAPTLRPVSPPAVAPKAQTTAELLERALRQATTHEHSAKPAKRTSRRKRALGVSAAAAVAVLLIGVVVNQNLPSLRLEQAAVTAGIDASLPSQLPSGFSLDNVQSSQGVIVTTFKSNSDDRSYTITQKRSSWSDSQLRDQFVAANTATYHTQIVGKRTIYLYGDQAASWLQAGNWFIIQSHGALSDRQLVELASSL